MAYTAVLASIPLALGLHPVFGLLAAVGPLSHAFRLRTTLVGAAVIILTAMLAGLASRSVRDLTNT